MRPYVLFAQAAIGLVGGFFFILGVIGTFSWRPGFNSGMSPVVGVFIGLPLIAVAVVLSELHSRTKGNTGQKIMVRCPSCKSLNEERVKFCGECGKPLRTN
jgi:hypothetical protein